MIALFENRKNRAHVVAARLDRITATSFSSWFSARVTLNRDVCRVEFVTPTGKIVANEGDWIAQSIRGNLFVMSNFDFMSQYDRVNPVEEFTPRKKRNVDVQEPEWEE